jgi:hypothetical protein
MTERERSQVKGLWVFFLYIYTTFFPLDGCILHIPAFRGARDIGWDGDHNTIICMFRYPVSNWTQEGKEEREEEQGELFSIRLELNEKKSYKFNSMV